MKRVWTLLTIPLFVLSLAVVMSSCGGGSGSSRGGSASVPEVIINSHNDGEQVVGSRTVILEGTLSDIHAIDSVVVNHNGVDHVPTFDQADYSLELTLDNHINTIIVTAQNAVGNSSDSETITLDYPFINITTFQGAEVVIGQADFTGQDPNQDPNQFPPADANTIHTPYGEPVVFGGTLYLPDFGNNRVLGFNAIPTANDARADFVLGQPCFMDDTPGRGADEMEGPQFVRVYNNKLFVAEWWNNRVLIWNDIPTTTQAPADVVVGQTGFGSFTPGCTASQLDGLESIYLVAGKLIVADANNNRVLIWNSIPTDHGVPADIVLGQPDFVTCTSGTSAQQLSYPSDVWSDGTRLIVADEDNHRVLIWNTFPTTDSTPADIVVGQSDMNSNVPGVSDRDLNDPYSMSSNSNQLFVADSGNNRVLIWDSIPTVDYAPADRVLGQDDFTHNTENDDNQDNLPDGNPSARTFEYPAGVYYYDDKLFVTDSFNHRYLIFEEQ